MIDNELDALFGKVENNNHKRKSLGRGLGALLGEDNDVNLDFELNNTVQSDNFVEICKLKAGKYQPRTEFDEEALNERKLKAAGEEVTA